LTLQKKLVYIIVIPKKRSRLSVLDGLMSEGGLAVLDHSQTMGWAEPALFASGGAGLVSTANNYLRFGRMLLGNGALDGVRVLSREMVEAMTTDYLTAEQHTHATFAFSTNEMWASREFGYGVQVLTTQTGLGPSIGTFGWPGGLAQHGTWTRERIWWRLFCFNTKTLSWPRIGAARSVTTF
jgi:CubicO group peptidase (beta-lactamase class C family)